MIVRCWVCHRKLDVADDRRLRQPSRDGYNTIDPTIRVCKHCWGKVKRQAVSQMPVLRAY